MALNTPFNGPLYNPLSRQLFRSLDDSDYSSYEKMETNNETGFVEGVYGDCICRDLLH